MKIGLVCPYDWDAPGGVQVHVMDQALEFIRLGHEVHVLAPSESDTGHPSWFTSGGPSRAVSYNGSVARLAFGLGPTKRVREWIREHDFDVLHVHEPLAPSLSALAVWAATGPIVGTFHSSMERSRMLAAGNALARTVLEKLRGRIAVSEMAKRTFVEHVGGEFVVIPNGIDTSAFAGTATLPGHPRPNSMVFLGRLTEPRKGLHVLLEALPMVARDVSDVSLVVAGPGDPASALATLHPQWHRRVEFLGFVSPEQKAATLRSGSVYVAPNTGGESFGIILSEAMAAGVPIVASDLLAFSTVLGSGGAGELFNNEDAADLAQVLVQVLQDPAKRARMVAAGRERVQMYDWTRISREVLDVYESVMAADVGVREDLRGQLVGRFARFMEL
jgi:phosphatidylinositol alpha-mannosyltransferase